MRVRSERACAWEGSKMMWFRRVVVAVTKMWRTALERKKAGLERFGWKERRVAASGGGEWKAYQTQAYFRRGVTWRRRMALRASVA